MRQELADRHAGLHMQAAAEVQSLQRLAKTTLAEHVAGIDVRHVTAVSVERANRELIAEQAVFTSGEIEQRTDGRVSLAVVIATTVRRRAAIRALADSSPQMTSGA